MIETTQLVAYVVALGITVAIPGPGMTVLVPLTVLILAALSLRRALNRADAQRTLHRAAAIAMAAAAGSILIRDI